MYKKNFSYTRASLKNFLLPLYKPMNIVSKLILNRKTTSEEIGEFCKSKTKFCVKNKNLVCKKYLQVNGYDTSYAPAGDDVFCQLYKELLSFSSNHSIKMNDAMLKRCMTRGSQQLVLFLAANGYDYKVDLSMGLLMKALNIVGVRKTASIL